jgi:hypothetical protein
VGKALGKQAGRQRLMAKPQFQSTYNPVPAKTKRVAGKAGENVSSRATSLVRTDLTLGTTLRVAQSNALDSSDENARDRMRTNGELRVSVDDTAKQTEHSSLKAKSR